MWLAQVAPVTVLEFLAASAWTRVVGTGHLLGTVGHVVGFLSRFTGVVLGSCTLVLVNQLFFLLGVTL